MQFPLLEHISDVPFLLGLVNSTHPFGFGLSVISEGKPLLGFLKLSYFHKTYTRVYLMVVVIVQSLSHVWLFATPWTSACQASLSFTISWSLLKLMSIESVMPSNHLILCHPLFLPPSIFPSIRVFSNETVLRIRWPKYWSFSFSISPSYEYSGLISFRIDWFDLLAVQETRKSLLQHHSSKASILWCSAFFIVQLSHPYVTAGKTITLTRWTFAGKATNMLPRFIFNILYTAAAAKSLQSCPTLCDPTDGSPPGSPIPGILQARTLDQNK